MYNLSFLPIPLTLKTPISSITCLSSSCSSRLYNLSANASTWDVWKAVAFTLQHFKIIFKGSTSTRKYVLTSWARLKYINDFETISLIYPFVYMYKFFAISNVWNHYLFCYILVYSCICRLLSVLEEGNYRENHFLVVVCKYYIIL